MPTTRFIMRLLLLNILLCLIAGGGAVWIGGIVHGMELAFIDLDHDLQLLDLNHGLTILLSPPSMNVDPDIAWSPDGQFITYIAASDFGVLPNLYVVNIGSERRQLVSWVRGGNPQLRWSPDGSQIAINTVPVDVGGCVMTMIDARSGASQQSLAEGHCGEFYWSSDGLYYSYGSRVFQADTHEPIYDTQGSVPRWSPDGRWMTFERQIENENRIYIAWSSGENERLLTNGRDAIWLPDGRIAFARSAAAVSDVMVGFWTIDVDSEVLTPITRAHYGMWSPDMRWSASLISDDIVDLTIPQYQRTHLYVLNVDSLTLSVIAQAEDHAGFAWRP